MAKELCRFATSVPDNVQRKDARTNERMPLVILFGWIGSEERYLAKYSTFYSEKGYITLMVSLPDLGLFFHADKTPEIVQDLFTVLSDNQLTHNPVIAHVFSNGGSMVYSHFTAALHDKSYPKPHGLQLRLKGVVFDSTPSKFSICVTVKAMMETVRSSALFRYALGLSIFTFLIIFQPLSKVVKVGFSNWYDLYDKITNDAARCPQLFLYSHADAIIPSADVKELVETRIKKGVEVKEMTWNDSLHVKHFLLHPEVYTKTCRDFAHSCLTSRL